MSFSRPSPALASNRRRKGVQVSLAAAVAAVLASQSASASNLTWKDSDSNNIWDLTATTNWVEGSAWNNSTPDGAIFAGTGETVTLGVPIIAGGLTFNSTGYTIDNGGTAANTLTLGGATPTITVTNLADSATINAVIAGTAGFTKAGAGTLTLSGLNSFTGVLTVANGTLKVGAAAGVLTGVLGASGVGNETVVQSGATLDINGKDLTAEIVKIVGTGVGGNGAIVSSTASSSNGLNRLVLTGDASVGGANRFDLRGGTAPTLDLAGFTLTKVGAAQFSVVGGTITSGDIAINAGILSLESTTTATGTGTITIGSGGTLGLYGNTGSITRAITSNGGTISNLGSTATIDSPITLSTGTTTTLAGTGAFGTNLPGVISGSGSLSKTGAGAFTLSGANTFTGNVTITGGILGINSDSALGAVPAAFTAANITLSGGTLANFSQATTSTNFSSGFDVNLNANRGITLAANSTIQVGYNKTMTINGQIAGAFTLTKSDNGTLVLNGDNSGFVGAGINTDSLILTGGAGTTLALGSDTAAGTGRINLNAAGGTIRSADANARTIANAINLSQNTVFGSVSTGNLTFTGAVAGGANSKGFTVNNTTTEFSGIISGSGTTTTFTKDGPGTLIFSGANTFTQSTTVNAGTLVLEYANQNNSKIAAAKALNLGSGKLTINPNGAADTTQTVLSTALTPGAATITVNKNAATNNATLNLNAISRAAGSTLNVIYGGTGTGVAAATTDTTNTNGILGGWATVNGADWAVNSTNAADGAIAGLASGGYTPLVVAATSDTANGSVSGSLTLSGAHTHNSLKVTSTAASQSLALGANLLTLNGGTSGGLLITGSNAYTISGTTGATRLTAGDNTTAGAYDLIVQQFNTGGATISAVIGDNGTHAVNLIKAGTGTLTLSGTNTFTGKTYVNSGTLSISSDAHLGAAPGAVVADQLTLNGGTLQATSTNFTLNTNRGITLGTAGGTVNLAMTSGNSVTYGGVISGGGLLTIIGTSATNGLILSTAQTYTGGTVINSGRINLNNAAATLGSGAVTINSGAGTGGSLYLSAGVTLANKLSLQGTGGEGRGAVRIASNNITLSGLIELLGNTTISSDTANTNTTISGAISGPFTLSFGTGTSASSTATYTVTGANNHAATVLGTGTLSINSDAALGVSSGTLTLNNGATLLAGANNIVLNSARGITLAGATGNIDTGTNTMTVAGVISGATANLTKAGTGTLVLTGANTYGGNTTVNAGTLRAPTAAVLPGYNTAGKVIVNNGGTLAVNVNGVGQWTSADIDALRTTVNFNAGSALGIDTTGGDFTYASTVSNASNAVGGTLGLGKLGTNTLTLTATNTYSGATTMSGGILTFANLGDATNGGNLGTSGNLVFASGTLQYTGGTVTTARNLSGTGTLELTQAGTIFTTTGTLSGGTLTKAGAGTLVLSGTADNASGGATVNAGLLLLDKASSATVHALGANTTINTTGTIRLGGTGGDQIYFDADVAVNTGGVLDLNGRSEGFDGLNGGGTVTNTAVSTTSTLTLGNNATATFSGVIQDGVGTVELIKRGTGTQTLSGANTYTGSTTMTAGTLALDYGTQNNSKLSDTAALTLNGGTLQITGATGDHTEVIGGVTLNGSVSITRSGVNTAKIALGNITRNAGGVLDVAATASPLASTTKALHSGVLDYVTVGGVDLATKDGSDNIVAYTGYSDVTRLNSGTQTIASAATSNVRIIEGTGTAANITLATPGTTDINSLVQSIQGGTSAATVDIGAGNTLRLGAAGTILTGGASAGALTIQNGTLTAGGADNAAGDLVISNTAANTINSVIANNGNGAVSLTKTGAGALTLSGANSYSGGTTLHRGLVTANSSTAFGSGAVTLGTTDGVLSQIELANGVNIANALTIGPNLGVAGDGGLRVTGTNSATWSGPITINNSMGNGGHFAVLGTSTLTLSGGITSSVPVIFRLGNVVLSGGGSYANTQITGTVKLGGKDGFATGASAELGTSGAATIDLNGFDQTLAGLTKGANGATVTNTGASSSVLTINNSAAVTYGGTIVPGTGGVSLVKSGAGTFTLTGANTYTGTTTINGGVLSLSGSGTIANTSTNTITVNAGGTLNFARSDVFGNHKTAVATPIVINAGGMMTNSGNFFSSLGPVTLAGGTLTATGGSSTSFPSWAFKGGVTITGDIGSTISASGTNAGIALGEDAVLGTTFDVADGAAPADLTVSAVLMDGRNNGSTAFQATSLTKIGGGMMELTAANTYVGPTIVGDGTLAVSGGIAGSSEVEVKNNAKLLLGGTSLDRIGDLASLTLGGGTGSNPAMLQLDNSVGHISESVGALELASTAVLDLGTGSAGSVFHFADSSAQAWTGTLSIYNWSSDSDHLFFGNNLAGLTSAQLSSIIFYSDAGTTSLGAAAFVGGGEIAPVPEPSALAMGVGMLGYLFSRRRRRSSR